MNYVEDIYRLKHIKRYSNIPTIQQESVAEHGFFVGALLLEFHDTYSFDLGKAIIMAIVHDMPELELNDCPHIIKKEYPEIELAYKICEERVTKQLPKEAQKSLKEFNEQKSVESKIVILADIEQCMQYAEGEIKLGNIGYMSGVLENSRKRRYSLLKELQKYER